MSDLYSRWREDHIIFLDDGFDADDVYQYLIHEGFVVERFRDHFQREDDHGREQSVDDPRVIKLCNRHGWILLTLDSSMKDMHRKEIAASPSLGIIATAHNTVDEAIVWAKAFVKLKIRIERNSFRKRLRPWWLQFSKQGNVTVGPVAVVWTAPKSPARQQTDRPSPATRGI